ncbi:MAG: NAD-dependent epimerase/dehydratase family protein [Gammaproteobacteria bacterium]|nr:NAD-dependent epimerase/dehydratase family protein [Gammaproteobacteria bacterium]
MPRRVGLDKIIRSYYFIGELRQEDAHMKTILVTGATGFVGSHVLMALAAHSDPDLRVIAACREPSRLPKGVDVEQRVGDLRDANYLRGLLDGVDRVCHAASWSSLWNHAEQSRALFLQPTLKLLEASVARGIERFMFVSTTSAPGPRACGDAHAPGLKPDFWPHLANVSWIEDAMRAAAGGKTVFVNLRCGLFAGERYGLGLLPILLPRLKTHLVPWIEGGRTGMPIIDGSDIGEAFRCACLAEGLRGYESFNITGPQVPQVREVIAYLHEEYGYPKPHFSVPFPVGYAFARSMELLDAVVPWEPLVVRTIIHLLEETHANNDAATARLGYMPRVDWRTAIRKQIGEMGWRQHGRMSMALPVN